MPSSPQPLPVGDRRRAVAVEHLHELDPRRPDRRRAGVREHRDPRLAGAAPVNASVPGTSPVQSNSTSEKPTAP